MACGGQSAVKVNLAAWPVSGQPAFSFSDTISDNLMNIEVCPSSSRYRRIMDPSSNTSSPPLRGYTQLATFMVNHGHIMLKQYRELAVRDLLYLQAELCDLQYDYAQQAKLDSQEQDERRLYDREWWHLQSDEARGGEGKQWQLALQIRIKLREYCK